MSTTKDPTLPINDRTSTIKLSLVPGIGPKTFDTLIRTFGNAQNALQQPIQDLERVPGIGPKLANQIEKYREQDHAELFELCEHNAIKTLVRSDSEYPILLDEIATPPGLLYYQGTLVPEDDIAIAIVGSRHATHYGKSQAESLGRAMALAGFTIISGLARGIDAAAHMGALQAGGRTIAVLGSGLLNIYPSEHKKLAEQIIEQGAVVSEYHPNQAPKSGSFPQRNRLVTGMSLGVIVVEAAQRSGALISARLATEQNREVFAVPGPINSRMSRGCHSLIKDGAKLVESIDDVLEELGPLSAPTATNTEQTIRHPAELKLTEQESKVLNSIGIQPTLIDEVIAKCGLPAQRVLSTISVLEIRKLIRRNSGTLVSRF